MEYIYSALLLHSAGKSIDEANVKKVLEAAGIKPDEARIKALTNSLEGVDIDEVIKSAALAPPSPQAPPAESKEKKEKKEKKKEEEEVSEEEAAAGLGALFG
jgi:large subunit ribosomal protein L12